MKNNHLFTKILIKVLCNSILWIQIYNILEGLLWWIGVCGILVCSLIHRGWRGHSKYNSPKREITLASRVGMNEGRFTLIIAASSYYEPETSWLSRAMDKCYCLMSEWSLLVTNDSEHCTPVGGNIDFGWVMLCISRVGLMKAWCLYLQHELGLILGGVSKWLCYPLI